MDLMVILQIIVLFGGIFLGIKIGGMGVGAFGIKRGFITSGNHGIAHFCGICGDDRRL